MPLNILSDQNIPNIQKYFARHGNISLMRGQKINNTVLKKIDLLLVRTITKINEKLLHNTPVHFVGSMTAGYDHVDLAYLDTQNIQFAYAPGCNAIAVTEYVLGCIAILQAQGKLLNKNLTAGVIGVGHVGSIVAKMLKQIGFKVLLNDPPRAKVEKNFNGVELSDLFACDLICLHTPLTTTGPNATLKLLNQDFIAKLKTNCVLINAGRGEVIDEQALLNSNLTLCLDVWTNEPNINLGLFKMAHIATPHIAGYSLQAKQNATQMVYQQCADFFGWTIDNNTIRPNKKMIELPNHWQYKALNIFNPFIYSEQCKAILSKSENIAEEFLKLRKDYVLRESFL